MQETIDHKHAGNADGRLYLLKPRFLQKKKKSQVHTKNYGVLKPCIAMWLDLNMECS